MFATNRMPTSVGRSSLLVVAMRDTESADSSTNKFHVQKRMRDKEKCYSRNQAIDSTTESYETMSWFTRTFAHTS